MLLKNLWMKYSSVNGRNNFNQLLYLLHISVTMEEIPVSEEKPAYAFPVFDVDSPVKQISVASTLYKCLFCKRSEIDELHIGPLYSLPEENVTVHYYCMVCSILDYFNHSSTPLIYYGCTLHCTHIIIVYGCINTDVILLLAVFSRLSAVWH